MRDIKRSSNDGASYLLNVFKVKWSAIEERTMDTRYEKVAKVLSNYISNEGSEKSLKNIPEKILQLSP